MNPNGPMKSRAPEYHKKNRSLGVISLRRLRRSLVQEEAGL